MMWWVVAEEPDRLKAYGPFDTAEAAEDFEVSVEFNTFLAYAAEPDDAIEQAEADA